MNGRMGCTAVYYCIVLRCTIPGILYYQQPVWEYVFLYIVHRY